MAEKKKEKQDEQDDRVADFRSGDRTCEVCDQPKAVGPCCKRRHVKHICEDCLAVADLPCRDARRERTIEVVLPSALGKPWDESEIGPGSVVRVGRARIGEVVEVRSVDANGAHVTLRFYATNITGEDDAVDPRGDPGSGGILDAASSTAAGDAVPGSH